MNNFARELNELALLSTSFCPGNEPLISLNNFLKQLKDFNEKYMNSYGDENLLHLKLKLLCHLSLIIQGIQKTDDKCLVVDFMKNLIRTSQIDDVEFFIHLYNSLSYEIYVRSNINLSEEFQLAVLDSLTKLIKSCTNRVLELLYTESYGRKFSMGILMAAKIAKEEKSLKLRIAALDFLLCAMQYHKRHDKVIQVKVGDLFMFYLPGVIRRLQEIILWNESQHHSITVKAITCWGQLVCTVMQDLVEEDTLSDEDQIKIWMNLSKNVEAKNLDIKGALQEKVRNKKWLQAAAQSIKPLIMKIPQVRKHSHPEVRLELISQISLILNECLVTLKDSLNPLMEIVISSTEDDDEQVREVAELALARFEIRCRDTNGQIFLEVIEEHLNGVINKLPGVLHMQDDKSILTMMESFCGDLKILRNSRKLGQIIHLSSNLVRLVRVLLISSTLSLHLEISSQDYSVWDHDLSYVWNKDWKIFKYFADRKIANKLSEICAIIGSDGGIETILDYLFEVLKEENSFICEILLLINLIVDGASNIQDNIIEQFLTLYLNPDYLYLSLQVDNDKCQNVLQARTNIMTVALLMEGLGKLSKVLGKKFEYYLLRSLYFVVEKMGSTYSVVRTSAVGAATEISESVGLNGDIGLLIQENIDYLTYHITIKLRRDNSGVFDVVTVLMKNSPFEAISNLEEIINNVLRTLSQKFDSPLTMSYLRLFQTFVRCVNKWMNDINVEDKKIPEVHKTCVDLLLEYIQEREKEKKDDREAEIDPEKEEKDVSEEEANVDEEKENDEDERNKSKNLPKHITLTVSIAENALNFLPSKDFDKKLLVLEILSESVLILANWEDELLPVVHKIWSPLVTRFEQFQDPLLINRSFTLLCNMSRTSKDFIRRRTLKNVLPTLREFLLKSAVKSKLKDSGTGYHFTQEFKLQKELLSNLGVIATDLGLSVKEIDTILEICFPYLSSFQPLPLQESCLKLCTDLKNYDPYVVWYRLHRFSNNTEYSKNVGAILNAIVSSRT